MAAVDLGDFTDVLRREVNPPGRTIFAGATDDDYLNYLNDAFWEARLDGFMVGWSCDGEGLVTPLGGGDATFPRQLTALCVVYAGIRILRSQILNTNTSLHAKAGPVEFERQNSATMLAAIAQQLQDTKNRLIILIQEQTPVYGFDAVAIRVFDALSHRSIYELI